MNVTTSISARSEEELDPEAIRDSLDKSSKYWAGQNLNTFVNKIIMIRVRILSKIMSWEKMLMLRNVYSILLCKLYDRTHDLYNTTCGLTSVSNKFEEYVDEKIQLK